MYCAVTHVNYTLIVLLELIVSGCETIFLLLRQILYVNLYFNLCYQFLIYQCSSENVYFLMKLIPPLHKAIATG